MSKNQKKSKQSTIDQNKNGPNEQIGQKLELLKTANDQYQDLFLDMCRADNGNMFPIDLLMQGIMQRSISLVDSVILLFEHKKYLTVMELLRNHLETLLTIYAIFIVDEPHEFSTNLMRGKKKTSDYKDKSGEKMSYSRLMRKFSQDSENREFNFDDKLYSKLSSFTHISNRHISYAFKNDKTFSNKLRLQLGDREISFDEKLEVLNLVITITRAQCKYIIGWTETKNSRKK